MALNYSSLQKVGTVGLLESINMLKNGAKIGLLKIVKIHSRWDILFKCRYYIMGETLSNLFRLTAVSLVTVPIRTWLLWKREFYYLTKKGNA